MELEKYLNIKNFYLTSSIGKTNLLNYNNKEKKFYKIIYEAWENNLKEVKIFGDLFISKNSNKFRIISNNKEMKIDQYSINKGKNKIIIKKEINKRITEMSYMFFDCNSLIIIRYFKMENKKSKKYFIYVC